VCTSEAGFFFGERRFDFFSGENKRDEGGLPAPAIVIRRTGGKAGEAVAAVDEFFDCKEQEMILRYGTDRNRDCRRVGTSGVYIPPEFTTHVLNFLPA